MKYLSEKITVFFVKNGFVSIKQQDIFQYSVETCLHNFLIVAFCLLYGFTYHMLGESVVFLFVFAAIRCFAGGVHAATRLYCFVVTVAMFICSNWMIIQIDHNLLACLAIVATGVIFRFAPLEHPSNYLSLMQKQKHRHLALTLSTAFLICSIAGMQMIPSPIWAAACTAIIMVAVFMALSVAQSKEFSIQHTVKPVFNLVAMAILTAGVSSIQVTCHFWGYQPDVSNNLQRYCNKK